MEKRIAQIGEFGLIEKLAKRIKLDPSVKVGIGDDASIIEFKDDKFLIFTTDMLVEDVHFDLKKAHPEEIGHKALGSNISDIAAMGGEPSYLVVSMGLSLDTSVRFVERLYRGMEVLLKRFHISLVGGDTNRSSKLIINIALLGEVEKRYLVLRRGAKVGDFIFVSGRLGGSLYGKHLKFIPRLKEARFLVKNFKISSMIDISDGLVSDLGKIIQNSKVGAVIYQNLISLTPQARSFKEALYMGEDFELLFTLSPKEAKRLLKKRTRSIKTPFTRIGEILPKKFGLNLITNDAKKLALRPEGFVHF